MSALLPILRRPGLLSGPFRGYFDRFFEGLSMPEVFGSEAGGFPVFDVSETEKEFIVKAELPGLDKENIEITLSGGFLTVRGEKRDERKEEKEHYHVRESYCGSFARTIRIPVKIKNDQVDAGYKDGVLRIVLPKAEGEGATKIEVKS